MTTRVARRSATGGAPQGKVLPIGELPWGLNGVALVLVALTGLLCLAMPFSGDQALFTVYGRQITDGAVLYRDVFDVKQPGIFFFFALGGSLFGFNEVGIHLLELGYWLAFAVFAVVALPRYFTARWAAPLVPVFTVAVYYLYARPHDLTQVELLVALPLVAAWWLIDQADPATRRGLRRYATAGLLAAVVVLLKHLYVVFVLGFLAYALLRSRRREVPYGDLGRAVLAFSVALVGPLLVAGAYFAAQGQLARIWWAYFEFIPGARSSVGQPLSVLIGGARRFLIGHGPILILAVTGALHLLRRRARPQVALAAAMLLWVAVGALLLFVQLWGEYKWLLFNAPLGILAVFGAEALGARFGALPRRTRTTMLVAGAALAALSLVAGQQTPRLQTLLLVAVAAGVTIGAAIELLGERAPLGRGPLLALCAALAVSVGLMAITPVGKLAVLREHDFATTVEARGEFRRVWYPPYRAADEDLAVWRSGPVLPGPMYVFGSPLVLLRANRPQAAALSGWSYDIYGSRAWQELRDDLQSSSPPYIVLNDAAASILRSQRPDLLRFIEREYEAAFVGASGTWHVRRESGETLGPTG